MSDRVVGRTAYMELDSDGRPLPGSRILRRQRRLDEAIFLGDDREWGGDGITEKRRTISETTRYLFHNGTAAELK